MERKSEILLFQWLRPHHLILFLLLWTMLGFICSYSISVGTGKVNALFPYISDTGTTAPASCVFGLMLNISAVCGMVVVYFRHGYIEQNNSSGSRKIHTINDISMFFGLLSSFGLMIVACFQETEVHTVHIVGAVLVFVFGVVYCYLQSYLSYASNEVDGMTSKSIIIIRIALTIVATLSLILMSISPYISKEKFKSHLKWKVGEPGYTMHLVSAFSEWIMAVTLLLFFATFYKEFKKMKINIGVNTGLRDDLCIA